MATRRRHTKPEIAAKLGIADELASQGKLPGDIAKSLKISVMTYYRWRKLRTTIVHAAAQSARDAGHTDTRAERTSPIEREWSQIRNLQLENLRLRHLVADLLLQKVELEERLNGSIRTVECA